MPQKAKNIWLLLASYYFYMCWNPGYIILIVFATLLSYACGLLIEKQKHKKLILSGTIIILFSLLFVFKYLNFAIHMTEKMAAVLHLHISLPQVEILLPVGISFYTFQVVGYVIDVYKGKIKAEGNILQYALFVSFFPQLVAGPIERSSNLISQLHEEKKFDWNHIKSGFCLILWGFFLKIVLADRLAVYVDNVYGNYTLYHGLAIIIATIFFASQIYCDFFCTFR